MGVWSGSSLFSEDSTTSATAPSASLVRSLASSGLFDEAPHPDKMLKIKILVTIKANREDADDKFFLSEFMAISYVIFGFLEWLFK